MPKQDLDVTRRSLHAVAELARTMRDLHEGDTDAVHAFFAEGRSRIGVHAG